MIKRLAIMLGFLAAVAALSGVPRGTASMVAQITPTPTPGFIPWYYPAPSPWPSPVFSANAAVGGAFGAGNLYNAGTNPFTTASPGIYMLDTGGCFFLCYGAPGQASHHVFAFGNDLNTDSYTSVGAPDDCMAGMTTFCVGGISNAAYSITVTNGGSQVTNGGYFLLMDNIGNLGIANNILAKAAVVAGAGTQTSYPSPTPGSLVSRTGGGKGELLLGGAADYVRCDYGETTSSTLTCNQPFVASNGGIRPNGASGGYAPEIFPNGAATPHPQVLSGSCSVSGSSACTFPNSFSFPDTNYNCTISAQGVTPVTDSYVKTSTTQITIHDSTVPITTFSYVCVE